MLASGILWLKYQITCIIQARKGMAAGKRAPEDLAEGADKSPDQGKQESLQRWTKIVQNDLETIPIGLLMNWGSLLCNPNPCIHLGLNATFVLGRLGHSVSYAYAKMPHRAIAYMLGVFATMGFVINGVIGSKIFE